MKLNTADKMAPTAIQKGAVTSRLPYHKKPNAFIKKNVPKQRADIFNTSKRKRLIIVSFDCSGCGSVQFVKSAPGKIELQVSAAWNTL
jgi:hypothetical protein